MKRYIKITIVCLIVILMGMQQSFALTVDKDQFKNITKEYKKKSAEVTDEEIVVEENYKIKYELGTTPKFTIENQINKTNADEIIFTEMFLIIPFNTLCNMNGITDENKIESYFSYYVLSCIDKSNIIDDYKKIIDGQKSELDLDIVENTYKDKKVSNDVFTLEFIENEKTEDYYSYYAVLTIKENTTFDAVEDFEGSSVEDSIIAKAEKNIDNALSGKTPEEQSAILDKQANEDGNTEFTNEVVSDVTTDGAVVRTEKPKDYRDPEPNVDENGNEKIKDSLQNLAIADSSLIDINDIATSSNVKKYNNTNENTNVANELPQTGIDYARINSLWGILIVSVAALIGCIIYRRKDK